MKHSDILLKFANYYLRRDHCHSPCYVVTVKFIFSDKVRLRRIDGVASLKYLIVSQIKIKRVFLFSLESDQFLKHGLNFQCLTEKFARIRRTQNPFSGYIYLMCMGCCHIFIYWLSVFQSVEFSFFSWKKPTMHVLSVDSYCFIISKCYYFHVLFCSDYHQK